MDNRHNIEGHTSNGAGHIRENATLLLGEHALASHALRCHHWKGKMFDSW
jgi:hypothetical protein